MEIIFAERTDIKKPITLELSLNDIEGIMIALNLRMAQLKYEGSAHELEELGSLLGDIGEVKFGADAGWWQRIKGRRFKVTTKPM